MIDDVCLNIELGILVLLVSCMDCEEWNVYFCHDLNLKIKSKRGLIANLLTESLAWSIISKGLWGNWFLRWWCTWMWWWWIPDRDDLVWIHWWIWQLSDWLDRFEVMMKIGSYFDPINKSNEWEKWRYTCAKDSYKDGCSFQNGFFKHFKGQSHSVLKSEMNWEE